MNKITREEVVAEVGKIVEGHEDTVADCFYAGTDGAPMCIVGHLIHRLEPEAFKSIVDRELLETYVTRLGINGVPLGFVQDDPKLLNALDVLQTVQDGGSTWGDAYSEFLRVLS